MHFGIQLDKQSIQIDPKRRHMDCPYLHRCRLERKRRLIIQLKNTSLFFSWHGLSSEFTGWKLDTSATFFKTCLFLARANHQRIKGTYETINICLNRFKTCLPIVFLNISADPALAGYTACENLFFPLYFFPMSCLFHFSSPQYSQTVSREGLGVSSTMDYLQKPPLHQSTSEIVA